MNNEALGTFFAEAGELSNVIEAALLECESGVADAETINTLFRAMHTIKGSAGLFGLAEVVAFAHIVETTMSRIRDGSAAMSPAAIALLLECRDHLNALIECAVDERSVPASIATKGTELVGRLQAHVGSIESGHREAQPVHRPDVEQASAGAASDCWHISLRYMPDTLRQGMDPLASLMFLNTFGEIRALEVLDDALPAADLFDAEACYLGFECRFATVADRARIESTFEFVRDECILTILPPRARIADYLKLIQELPEAEARLGEILVKCGSVTQPELDAALSEQRQQGNVAASRPLGEILVARQVVPSDVVEAAVEKQRANAEARAREQRTVRVDADRIEALLNLVGELVVESAQAKHLAQRSHLSEVHESAGRLSRLVEQIRDHALKLRMLPIGGTFARFSRIVRDVARELGKEIALETHGNDTELDKALIEQIVDPLTHLVRNAIDHGIEQPHVRAARGKRERGTIRLNAFHDGGSVVIEVADDGGGLDCERILRKARDKGLVGANQQLSQQEIFNLIFAAGFSTAEAVTNLSGRGVGMDVVKRNVAALRGEIDIESDLGVGTTIRIRLPLTLAIIDGFLVRVGGCSFVIPLELVDECVGANELESLAEPSHGYIDLRGRPLPLLRLRDHFGIAGRADCRESIVVVRAGKQHAGLIIDEVLGEHQTVIKPLSRVFTQVAGLSGSTILADGGIALILDAPALLSQVSGPAEWRGEDLDQQTSIHLDHASGRQSLAASTSLAPHFSGV